MKKSNHDPPGAPKLNVRESDFDKRSLLLMQPNASGGSQSLSGGCFKPPSTDRIDLFFGRRYERCQVKYIRWY